MAADVLGDIDWLDQVDWSMDGIETTNGQILNDCYIGPEMVTPHSVMELQGSGVGVNMDTYTTNDSDCSWTVTDNQDIWYANLRQQLRDFRTSEGFTIVTPPLGSQQRKQVHSTANLWSLSHMSIGSGKLKRVLISKCAIFSTSEERIWNPAWEWDSWSRCYISPRLVLFHWISSNICFQTCLQVLGLPTPTNFTMVVRGDYGTVYALFETTGDASSTMLALNGSRPHWNTTSIYKEVECCYLRLPHGFELTTNLLGGDFCRLPVQVLEAFDKQFKENPNQPSSRPSSPQAVFRNRHVSTVSGTVDPNELASALSKVSSTSSHYPLRTSSAIHSRQGSASRRMSLTSSVSRDPGYASASSQLESDYSVGTNASKKRKRWPKLPGGYPCPADGCGRVFDHQGELTKHEKTHTGSRPYICHCGKGFLYPKDLRRHERSHVANSTPVSPIMEPVGGVSDPETADNLTIPSLPGSYVCRCCVEPGKMVDTKQELTDHGASNQHCCAHCKSRYIQ
jgi:hypothetical protein